MESTPPVFLKEFLDETDPVNATKYLTSKLRPEWKDVVVEKLTGGYINIIICSFFSADTEKNNALVTIIFQEESFTGNDHFTEIQNMQIANSIGLFPEIVALFKNGVVYKYAKGRNVRYHELFEPSMISLMMESLAKLHFCHPEATKLWDSNGQTTPYRQVYHKDNVYQQLINIKTDIPDLQDIPSLLGLVGREPMLKEWRTIQEQLEKMNIPTCLNHNDFHMNNMIFYRDTITLLDYPNMSVNYEAYDIGHLFAGYDFFIALGAISENDKGFDDKTRLQYCRSYLQHKRAIQNTSSSGVSEETFKKWCDVFEAVSTFVSLGAVMGKHTDGTLQTMNTKKQVLNQEPVHLPGL